MTAKGKVVSIRVPETLDDLIDLCSQDNRTDKVTTMRQWLYYGAEDYALRLVAQGRISATRAAELLDLSIWDIHRLAEERGLVLGSTKEQYQRSRKMAAKLVDSIHQDGPSGP